MEINQGTQLGPYQIVKSIGAGGMGEVWQARDARLDRNVAIKILPRGLAHNAGLLERFEREAKAISSLNHPHICTLHDVGQTTLDGQPEATHYLVMELIDGESLGDLLKKGPLPLQQVLEYGWQIASALDAAHRQGIIHRDLKPDNVMLTRAGAKLLDFGLAKATQEKQAPLGCTHGHLCARCTSLRDGNRQAGLHGEQQDQPDRVDRRGPTGTHFGRDRHDATGARSSRAPLSRKRSRRPLAVGA
jgi:serine/threonine protein kinase